MKKAFHHKMKKAFVLALLLALFVACMIFAGCTHRHDFGEWKNVSEATCIWEGKAVRECKLCGQTEAKEIPATGHKYVKVDGSAASCTHTGTTDSAHCVVCGRVLVGQAVLPMLQHKPVTDSAVEPTFEHSGLTEGSHCSVCGTVIVKQNTIPQLKEEDFAFKVTFVCGNGTVRVFNLQDFSDSGSVTNVAYSRSKSGVLLKDGEGQVNFTVTAAVGYQLKSVTVSPSEGYNKLKDSSEAGIPEKGFRITKINQNLVVTISFEPLFSNLPAMVINTENNAAVTSKEVYTKCSVSVYNAEKLLDGCYNFEGASGKIRGRGNSTWGFPKKPYKLKFDEKTDLFGNGSAKTWTLIANYVDPSLVRNFLAYELGALLISDGYTTKTQFVDLYFNGKYCGVYLVCEQVETGSTRVNISDKMNKLGPAEIDYLVELDARIPEEGALNRDYFVLAGYNYAVKSPDTEDPLYLTDTNSNGISDYLDCIRDFMTQCHNAIASGNYQRVADCIDVMSFAETFVVHEILKSTDVGYASFYMYAQGGKLHSGPIWDFDISSGNCDYANITTTTLQGLNNPWYNRLLRYSQFRDLVKQILVEKGEEITNKIEASVSFVLSLSEAFNRDNLVWHTLGTYVWPNPQQLVAIKTWQGQVEYLHKWLTDSFEYLFSYFVGN